MKHDYKVEATKELAEKIKLAGFRVFIAKRGTHGFYTDDIGSRVVSFQYDLGGFSFTGQYKTDQPRSTGTGWQLVQNNRTFAEMFNERPTWSLRGAQWKFTTLEQFLATYQASSVFTELTGSVPSSKGIHYGMTQAQARRKTGSNGNFEGPLPLCGNGNYHADVTSDIESVTCEACKAILKTRPNYL